MASFFSKIFKIGFGLGNCACVFFGKISRKLLTLSFGKISTKLLPLSFKTSAIFKLIKSFDVRVSV